MNCGNGHDHATARREQLVDTQEHCERVFRRDVLDRAAAKISIPSLYERRHDIGELAQAFSMEAAGDLEIEDGSFFGLTRRARSDVETAVVRAEEVSVRRLREIIRERRVPV